MIKRILRNFIWLTICLFLISSCSVFSPVKVPNQKQFMLSELPIVDSAPVLHGKVLVVTSPIIFSPFATRGIAYISQKQQISYFSKSVWAAAPADMLQLLIIQSLQKTNHFNAVIKPHFVNQYDFVLHTWVTELDEDLTGIKPVFKITIQAVLFDRAKQKVVGIKDFHAESVLNDSSIYSAIISANQAMAIVLKQLSNFCIMKI